MSDFNLPAKKPDDQLIYQKDVEVEADFVEIENREVSKRSQPTALAQIGQVIVHSLLSWVENRLTTRRNQIDRRDGGMPSQQVTGNRQETRVSVESKGRFGSGRKRQGQCRRFGNRPIRRRRHS